MKTDLRVRYTKHILKESLLQLLKELPLNKVTVKDLCLHAHINRSTFYTHYKDVYDLFEQIENDFIDEIYQLYTPSSLPINEKQKISAYIDICQFCLDNKELYLIMNGPHGDPEFIRKIYCKVCKYPKTLTIISKTRYKDVMHHDIAVTFLFEGTHAVIYDWLNEHSDVSIDIIANILVKLNYNGMNI